MTKRRAERAARKFIATNYPDRAHWSFDITEEEGGRSRSGSKCWSFAIRPDEEDHDYERGVYMVGYVHPNGNIEGLY